MVDHCRIARGCGKVESCRMAENYNPSERYTLQMEHWGYWDPCHARRGHHHFRILGPKATDPN